MAVYDITLNGVAARVKRGQDDQSTYQDGTQRQSLEQQYITDLRSGHWQSRADLRPFYQKSWSGGTRWEKPIMVLENESTYNIGRNMDGWSRPGWLLPLNIPHVPSGGNGMANGAEPSYATLVDDILYTTDGATGDIYELSPTDLKWVDSADGALSAAVDPQHGTLYDPVADRVYVLGDTVIKWWTPGTGTAGTFTSTACTAGSNIFRTIDGRIVWYNGNTFRELTTPTSTPGEASFDDDGLGADYLSTQATTYVVGKGQMRMAVSSPDGIWYVKNVLSSEGVPIPYVFRLNRDSAGAFIRQPVTNLPPGNVVTSIMWHNGSLLCMGTGAYAAVKKGAETDFFESVLWQIDNGIPTAVGILDGNDSPIDVVPNLIGSDGQYVYMGGVDGIWVFDTVRGGVHMAHDIQTEYSKTPAIHQFFRMQVNSVPGKMFLGTNGEIIFKEDESSGRGLDSVGSFNESLTTYRLESNYFDFGTPHEEKTLTHIMLDTELLTSDQMVYVQVSVDDGAWQSAVTAHTAVAYSETDVTASAFKGRRFRYRIIYQTLVAGAGDRYGIRSIMLKASGGENVRRFAFSVEGKAFRNLQNEPIRAEDVFNSWQTLAANEDPVTFTERFHDVDQEDVDSHTVKIDSVVVGRGDAMEIDSIDVQLTVL